MPDSECPHCGALMPGNRLAKHLKKQHPDLMAPFPGSSIAPGAGKPTAPIPKQAIGVGGAISRDQAEATAQVIDELGRGVDAAELISRLVRAGWTAGETRRIIAIALAARGELPVATVAGFLASQGAPVAKIMPRANPSPPSEAPKANLQKSRFKYILRFLAGLVIGASWPMWVIDLTASGLELPEGPRGFYSAKLVLLCTILGCGLATSNLVSAFRQGEGTESSRYLDWLYFGVAFIFCGVMIFLLAILGSYAGPLFRWAAIVAGVILFFKALNWGDE